MFKVVKHEQSSLPAQGARDGLKSGLTRGELDPEHSRQLGHELGISSVIDASHADRDAIRETRGDAPRCFHSESCLPGSARAGNCQQRNACISE